MPRDERVTPLGQDGDVAFRLGRVAVSKLVDEYAPVAAHQVANFVGKISSGYRMAAVQEGLGLDAAAGLKSWQQLLVADGITFLPVALAGFVSTKSLWHNTA
ncbi:hypothetical protein B0T14DRAFT_499329 [Immersiella caudata]|uniref:Uncharacterized protein n=1 Tax=Immersiella caudata TaxID=314043 RepID=A0AA39WEL0_9PEZI|nr:hypothetical protein B0T14DRAFT_499329 [Immersiella caudata]